MSKPILSLKTEKDCLKDLQRNENGLKISRLFFLKPITQEEAMKKLYAVKENKHKIQIRGQKGRIKSYKRTYIFPSIQQRIFFWSKHGFVNLIKEEGKNKQGIKWTFKKYVLTLKPLFAYFKDKNIELTEEEKKFLYHFYEANFPRKKVLELWPDDDIINMLFKAYILFMNNSENVQEMRWPDFRIKGEAIIKLNEKFLKAFGLSLDKLNELDED